MRALLLLVLSAGLMVGCSSTSRYDRATPRNARVDARPGSAARPYVCHNGNTIAISRNAVRAHRRHGDSLGACTRRDRREARRDQRTDRRDQRNRRADRRDRRDDRAEARNRNDDRRSREDSRRRDRNDD